MRANAVEGEGTWTPGEIERFQAAYLLHGANWPKIKEAVGTRELSQIRSFAWRFLVKHPPSTWSTPVAPADDEPAPAAASDDDAPEEAVRVQGPVAELLVVAELLGAIQDLRISRGDAAVGEVVASFTARVREATVSGAVGIDDAAGAGPSPVVEPLRQSSRQREARARARDAAGARTL